jgi:hypothetical protein
VLNTTSVNEHFDQKLSQSVSQSFTGNQVYFLELSQINRGSDGIKLTIEVFFFVFKYPELTQFIKMRNTVQKEGFYF